MLHIGIFYKYAANIIAWYRMILSLPVLVSPIRCIFLIFPYHYPVHFAIMYFYVAHKGSNHLAWQEMFFLGIRSGLVVMASAIILGILRFRLFYMDKPLKLIFYKIRYS